MGGDSRDRPAADSGWSGREEDRERIAGAAADTVRLQLTVRELLL